jgi:hypothetical protein
MTKADDVLRPDNQELFDRVRDKLNQRSPSIPMASIADEIGVSIEELCRWFIGFREPRDPHVLPPSQFVPRDPTLRAEMYRLREREASLVTVATEAPAQLGRVQRRILSLERAR